MALSKRAVGALLALTLLPLAVAALLTKSEPAGAQGAVPSLTSPNVRAVTSVPGTAAISGVFSRSAPFFYVSGLDAITVLDVTDPRNPRRRGRLPNAVFQNEAVTLGERVGADGQVQRFILVGNDLAQASLDPQGRPIGRVGGRELIVVDVTDPDAPRIRSRTPGSSSAPGVITTSTHTVACMNAACTVAYTAGGEDGQFSIVDLSNLDQPRQVREVRSPATGPGPIGDAGHHWNVDGEGIAWHVGSGGAMAYDISDPLNPVPLNGTDANGTRTPYNDFIHHSSQRPNARAFRPGQPASFENGNVLLVGEEDYAFEGDEVVCERSGSFQTWEVPDLDGARYRSANPQNEPNRGTVRVLDAIQAPAEAGLQGGATPAGGFCSTHWFDFHQSGTVAVAHYQQGLRIVDARNPRDLRQIGFAAGGGTEVWDAYWVPERTETGTTALRRTNLIYTVDAVRGVDVYEVTGLPPDLRLTGDIGSRGTFPAPPARPGPTDPTTGAPGTPTACAPPESTFSRGSRITRRGLTLRGTARGRGCAVRRVRVAVGRKVGSRCRFLRADGRFGRPTSCRRTRYLSARGTTRWTLRRRVRLPRGEYLLWSRAIDSAGNIERKARRRNLLGDRAVRVR
jgi:hypothetical protein